MNFSQEFNVILDFLNILLNFLLSSDLLLYEIYNM